MTKIPQRQRRAIEDGIFSIRNIIPRWLTVLVGLAGSVLGIATNLYSSAFRSAISFSGKHIGSILVPTVLAALVASGSTLLIYRWLIHRREDKAQILPGEIIIGSDALDSVGDERDLVAGRILHYIEAQRPSDDLLVFLHGLGLDANDFRPYMAESRFHCIALTLYGFNTNEKNDNHYKAISLQSHVQLLAYALNKIHRAHFNKRITLVGFSFGADIIFFLMQFAARAARDLNIRKAILLDPNVNESTTTISSRIAVVDKEQPLTELVKILDSAGNMSEFRNLCEYLYKITSKDFAQIQRHAREVLALVKGESYDKFLNCMGQLSSATEGIHVVLSFDYEQHFNAIARGAVARGMDARSLECSRCGHFDLIGTSFLKETLEGVLATGSDDLLAAPTVAAGLRPRPGPQPTAAVASPQGQPSPAYSAIVEQVHLGQPGQQVPRERSHLPSLLDPANPGVQPQHQLMEFPPPAIRVSALGPAAIARLSVATHLRVIGRVAASRLRPQRRAITMRRWSTKDPR